MFPSTTWSIISFSEKPKTTTSTRTFFYFGKLRKLFEFPSTFSKQIFQNTHKKETLMETQLMTESRFLRRKFKTLKWLQTAKVWLRHWGSVSTVKQIPNVSPPTCMPLWVSSVSGRGRLKKRLKITAEAWWWLSEAAFLLLGLEICSICRAGWKKMASLNLQTNQSISQSPGFGRDLGGYWRRHHGCLTNILCKISETQNYQWPAGLQPWRVNVSWLSGSTCSQ